MKDIFKQVIYSVMLIACVFVSLNVFAGGGDGSPNPTGGFGSGGSYEDPNPTGAFGDYTEDFQVQQAPPPPDPNEIPLDGGAIFLILSGIGIGAGAIVKKMRR